MSFYLQSKNAPALPSEIHITDVSDTLQKICLEKIEAARLEGFADCEELVASMFERMADEEGVLAGIGATFSEARGNEHGARSRILREAALAVRLGQHRREVEP